MTHVVPFSEMRTQGKAILQKLGSWDKFGASGWPLKNQSMFDVATKHSNSRNKTQYYTPALETAVRSAYAMGYELFEETI
jgi:hypothetical protein